MNLLILPAIRNHNNDTLAKSTIYIYIILYIISEYGIYFNVWKSFNSFNTESHIEYIIIH